MITETQSNAPSSGPKSIPAVKVIGVGGAGLNALEHLMGHSPAELVFAGLHTDARRLDQTRIGEKLLLGVNFTRGLGAGGDPEIGRAAAEAESEKLRQLCAERDVVVVVTGLGRGTGSGAAPVLARVARESGALVLALATLPFEFEGARRQEQARQALRQLRTASDAVLCLPNQRVAGLVDENTTFGDTFRITNEMLAQGVRGLWRLLAGHGLLNVAFADLCHVVRGRQAESHFATAEAMGENRSTDVVQQILTHPLLDHGRWLAEADAVLVSLAGGPDLTLKEVHQVMGQLNRACEKAQMVMGAAIDAAFHDRLAVTLVAAKHGPVEGERPASAAALVAELEPPRSEFPTTALDLEVETASPGRGLGERPASRFVPPPPALSPERVEELLREQRGGSVWQRKKASRWRQGLLPLEVVSKGRFAKSEPTIHQGEDLDTPTYIRRGVALN